MKHIMFTNFPEVSALIIVVLRAHSVRTKMPLYEMKILQIIFIEGFLEYFYL